MKMENELENLRERLREYMKKNDLTIPEIARMLDRYPLTVWNFLRKNSVPRIATAAKIKALVSGVTK